MGILQNIGLFENISLDNEVTWFEILDQYTLLKGESSEFKKTRTQRPKIVCRVKKMSSIFIEVISTILATPTKKPRPI